MRYIFLTLICLSQAACDMSFLKPGAEEKPPTRFDVGPAYECLREAIYFEAGNHAPDARAAVAHVILNRVADPRFPNTVCGVITEGEARQKCQFEYRCILDPERIRWPEQMDKASETAARVLGGQHADPTDGALFFHAKWMRPGWFATRTRVGQFGGNIFYL